MKTHKLKSCTTASCRIVAEHFGVLFVDPCRNCPPQHDRKYSPDHKLDHHASNAERGHHLDPQSLVAQSGGVLIGSPLFVAGKLLWLFDGIRNCLVTMRITMLNDDMRLSGVAVPLRILATSPNPLEAAYWQKIMELVDYLQSNHPERELEGHAMFKELILCEPSPPNPVRDQHMRKFAETLRASNPDPATWGTKLIDELKRFHREPEVSLTVRVDWRDYGPVQNGIPLMHYRFQLKRFGRVSTEDARATTLSEARTIICDAFDWPH